MKRSGMNLRSTTSIKPQLTNIEQSSPLKQTVDAKFDIQKGANGNMDISNNTKETKVLTDKVYTGIGACDKLKKGDNLATDSAKCKEYIASKNKCAGLTQEELMDPANGCTGHAQDETITPGSTDEASGLVSSPGGTTPRTNILTPREMRRNMRMMRISSNGTERLKKIANRNVRQAIRRGEAPDEKDMNILSGESLGSLDGINIMQDSTGTTNLFTKQQTSAFQQNPGGEKIEDETYQNELEAQLKLLQADDTEYDSMEAVMKKAKENTRAELGIGKRGQKGVKAGQYLTNRTKRTMRRRNVQPDGVDTKKSGRSQRRKDSDARDVTKYTKRLEGVSKSNKFDPDNKEGMSRKKYDRINRRLKKNKDDGKSPFKKKESPMHMTVNVTKPSYKMGGFGSK